VAQSMATMCHLYIGLKFMLLAGFDPVTSRKGKALGRATQLVRPHVLLNICMHLNLFEFEMMCNGVRTGSGLSPDPRLYMYVIRPLLWVAKPVVIYMCCVTIVVCEQLYI
jgi:hypothetical protein